MIGPTVRTRRTVFIKRIGLGIFYFQPLPSTSCTYPALPMRRRKGFVTLGAIGPFTKFLYKLTPI
jgi:hypothetical protein